MMKELLVDSRTIQGEQGAAYLFDYYVLVDQMEVREGFACESYGVKIAPSGLGDGCAIPNITTSVSKIDALMENLTKYQVTPTTLPDVVQDWME